ncbi:hypothetical protein, partial [Parvibaculum sp.]|uniref:hypothetical protein n=1 Tax=Parvibaculum sp. TaxID=2024848 RepID=UPI002FD9F2B7
VCRSSSVSDWSIKRFPAPPRFRLFVSGARVFIDSKRGSGQFPCRENVRGGCSLVFSIRFCFLPPSP